MNWNFAKKQLNKGIKEFEEFGDGAFVSNTRQMFNLNGTETGKFSDEEKEFLVKEFYFNFNSEDFQALYELFELDKAIYGWLMGLMMTYKS